MQDAHNLFVIKQGVVVEQGTHQQLLSNESLYATLVAKQTLHGHKKSGDDDSEDSSEGDGIGARSLPPRPSEDVLVSTEVVV